TTGNYNAACGKGALIFNTGGDGNTASGYEALRDNASGAFNTASGDHALRSLTTGNYNVAVGTDALLNLTGASSNNIVIGTSSGTSIVTGQDNICINHIGRNLESGNILIRHSVQTAARCIRCI